MKKILLAIFCCMLTVIGIQAQSYVKVTSELTDWGGRYLIVYEANNVAFNGGLEKLDAASNTIDVEIVDNAIAATSATQAAEFTIAPYDETGESYTIQSASGYYIGVSSNSNGLNTTKTSTVYKNALGLDQNGNAVIMADFSRSTYNLRFNKTSDQNRFRYYNTGKQQAIQLYKYTEPEEGAEIQLAAPTFTPEGGAVAEGTEVTIATIDGATIEYTVNGVSYTSTENTAVVTINEDTEIVAKAVTDMEGYTPSDEVTVNYTVLDPVAAGDYELVTDASTLRAGNKIVIVAAEYDYALSTTQKSNNRGQIAVTKNDDNTVTLNNEVQIITLQEGSADATFAFYVENSVDEDGNAVDAGYLYAASSSKNNLKTKTELDANGCWEITIADGVASVVAQGSYTRSTMQYNQSSSLFACYSSASQKGIAIYRMIPYTENIKSDMIYYLKVNDDWTNGEGDYTATFTNKNTGAYAEVTGEMLQDNYVLFFLSKYNNGTATRARAEEILTPSEPYYTHVNFTKGELTTGELTFTDGTDTYSIADNSWISIPSAIEAVEVTNGIAYANGIVTAEGAIEVYDMSGVVVARGNDNADLRALNGGIYIVRNGENVRKVVR